MEAQQIGRDKVTIEMAEVDKDDFIFTFRETYFSKTYCNGVGAVPMTIVIQNITIKLESREDLESGTMILSY